MVDSTLTLEETDRIIKRIQTVITMEYSKWRDEIFKGTAEDTFNRMSEIAFKIHIVDEIINNFENIQSAMYVTESDYDTLLVNLNNILEAKKNLLEEIYEKCKESPDYMTVDHAIIVEQLWEIFAEDQEVF